MTLKCPICHNQIMHAAFSSVYFCRSNPDCKFMVPLLSYKTSHAFVNVGGKIDIELKLTPLRER